MSENRAQNELVLSPGEYAYTQDMTSGVMKTYTGPNIMQVGGQESPVLFDQKTGRFKKVALTEVAQQFVMAQQGQYIVLSNPARDTKQPDTKSKSMATELNMGQKVIIQGPITFALWPGQSASVIDGHNLRSNQYLRIRVRDEQAAKENWTKGVIKAATAAETDAESKEKGKGKAAEKVAKKSLFSEVPADLAVGKHYIVRGDEFSFYIPPTGVEVVPDEDGSYVRDAVTLERLEYCILIDENGNKRYERGPAVVFPHPTERFLTETHKGVEHIVFQPIELNEIQGLHIKVISDYEENGKKYKEGEELFIRGKEMPIYFPRPEHSMVSYDGKHKHFATAVPAGEARYVLERTSGEIATVNGPAMLLPDPRSEVIVRRVLTEKQCQLWYPGNQEAAKYNSALRSLERGVSSTRGAVSEGEVTRSRKIRSTPVAFNAVAGLGDKSTVHSDTLAIGAEEFERSATYTEPRTLTLDTKFSGVPTIEVWTGYAVLVIDKRGNRRVEIGPKTVQLGYDETLEVLSMSTGKPKNTDALLQTVYLRVKNNQISDVIAAETRDHVNVSFKVSLRGDFTGEPSKWFEAENYVKLVCDHVRSVAKAQVRKLTIEELYSDPAGLFRNAILGEKAEGGGRKGMLFNEMGFQLNDVEVLGFTVGDDRIAKMLDNTQHQVVESNISLALAEKKLQIEKRTEELNRERAAAKTETERTTAQLVADLEKFNAGLESERTGRKLAIELEKLTALTTELKKKEETLAEEQRILDAKQEAELNRRKAAADLDASIKLALQEIELARTREETKAVIDRFQAASGTFAEALVALNSQETMVKVAEAMGIQNYIGGPNLVEAIRKVFEGTALGGLAQATLTKAVPATNGATEKQARS